MSESMLPKKKEPLADDMLHVAQHANTSAEVIYADGEPCEHPNCLVSFPCERCRRYNAEGLVVRFIPPPPADIVVIKSEMD